MRGYRSSEASAGDALLECILDEIAMGKGYERPARTHHGQDRRWRQLIRCGLFQSSDGKDGLCAARVCRRRGAGGRSSPRKTNLEAPYGVTRVVTLAQDMFEAVSSRAKEQDMIIKAAAVADYRPVTVAENKIKKSPGDMSIALERTTDILAWLGEHRREGQVLCGFAMETEHMVEHAKEKLTRKHVDMIAANNVKVAGAGFGTDTNVVTLITEDGVEELAKMSKEEVASRIVDALLRLRGNIK